ncbi:uncharacterized protein LOC125501460 [Athalia rosae]|uniref:uncharacterized protein LOC125501460 n=1 Tax=Athalia rosae TaxID=37344 RepID=UPI0020336DD8|nr:uncharacterized protein LOC125501460 [Athalia rosae]
MSDDSKTGWIWKLSKEQLKIELQNRGVPFSESDKRDNLRELLVKFVRQIAEKSEPLESSKVEGIEPLTSNRPTSTSVETKTKAEVDEIESKANNSSDFEESYDTLVDSDTDSTMSENNSKIKFCLNKDKWDTFIERLEFQFLARDTVDAKKAAILLTSIDEDAYELIKHLCSPEKLSDKKYDELTKLMQDHLSPQPSEVIERNKFYKAFQEQSESVTDFATRLKKLSLYCKFSNLEDSLRDQFVCGLRDQETKVKLFEMDSLTYNSALKGAVARETAQKNASSSNERRNFQQDVLALDSHSSSMRQNLKSSQKKNYVKFPRSKIGEQSIKDNTCWNCGGRGHTRYQCPSPSTSKPRQNNECASCGKAGHRRDTCKYKNNTCEHCHKYGHIQSACFSKKAQAKSALKKLDKDNSDCEDVTDDEQASNDTHYISASDHRKDFYKLEFKNKAYVNKTFVSGDRDGEPMYVNVCVNDTDIKMEIDTGTYETVISEKILHEKFKKWNVCDTVVSLRGYDGTVMNPIGKLSNLKINLRNKTRELDCYVLPGRGPALLGRKWLAAFGCWPLNITENLDKLMINKIDIKHVPDYIINKYNELFSNTPGCYNKSKSKIYLKDGTKPIAFKCRHVAHALKPLIENEIERLVSLDHLEPVEVSEWATPIVPVFKSNGNIRICGDFKITVNPHIIMNKYPLHTIDDIFSALQGGLTFTELDLRHAYMQFEVDESCRDLLTIITHKGSFRYKKIPEGIAPAPADVQKKMDECLAGINGTISYIDNIYVTGRTNEEHIKNLEAVCARLQKCGLRVNVDKSKFMQDKLDVLGYAIDKNGLHKSKTKVDAMVNAPQPSNTKELASFLENLKPLYDLANQKEFVWNDECKKAFRWVKNELISPRVLAHYDPNEQIILACDASHYGLSAILSHKYKDNTERPIAYASQTIPKKELNRTILDKEAMAIVLGKEFLKRLTIDSKDGLIIYQDIDIKSNI